VNLPVSEISVLHHPAEADARREPSPAFEHAASECDRTSDADLELLLTIRHFEELLLDLFGRGQVKGTTHTCLGQEYIPVALAELLAPQDYVFSNHRGHGHFLARIGDERGLLAEILGKEGAVGAGVGGSQHVFHQQFLSTGIQAELLPVAAGVAWRMKHEGVPGLAVVFIGDGTCGEGGLYETLNLARLWSLPLLVIVENNHISQSTPSEQNLAGSIKGRARAFDIEHVAIASQDITEIRDRLRPRLERMRIAPLPLVVEFDTVRVGPHSKGDDTRAHAQLTHVRTADWYARLRGVGRPRFARIEARVEARLRQLASDVLSLPDSSWSPNET
jgi:pyruvate dehydrogenase E1 component alpha subunit